MDSYKELWGAEGCSSSESGWTMYIDSPMQEDDAECSNENDGYCEIYSENIRKKQGIKVDADESDDSMASDASSGPIQYQNTNARGESNHGIAVSKKDKQDHGSNCSSRKNASKQEKKSVDSRSKKR
ncbi:hypothetical protein TanjilG_08395 [Lupinus angustifolius]|uniref:Uncharacterized protein n=2 Tax=Lupinus angustifolius TaxID=3871 RepID=A0A1J7H339_LUPAN|nr:PREDICTED: uncharacterized protein LOC109354065 isoform X2 [Lupinus angustifolius]OIW07280.1 hypothetical protein TanjilG_08395 [Lupinus angustifolius]